MACSHWNVEFICQNIKVFFSGLRSSKICIFAPSKQRYKKKKGFQIMETVYRHYCLFYDNILNPIFWKWWCQTHLWPNLTWLQEWQIKHKYCMYILLVVLQMIAHNLLMLYKKKKNYFKKKMPQCGHGHKIMKNS